MLNRERLVETFLTLARIDSESRSELDLATHLRQIFESMGAETLVDDAATLSGGNSGNLFVRIRGNSSAAQPLFFSAHMDTVPPGRGVQPRLQGEWIVSDGSTVLGADDKSGCAILVELVRTLREGNLPHGDLELCFTVCEETGLLGAKAFDTTRAAARIGLVLDAHDPQTLFHRAPAANRLEWIVRGVEAHAAVAPERGISSLRIAAQAIAAMKFGRIDAETTANVGVAESPGATNIVSAWTRVEAEARSLDETKLREQTEHMSGCFHRAVEAAAPVELESGTARAQLEEKIVRDYESLNVSPDAAMIRLVRRAAQTLGFDPGLGTMAGACDANVFTARGIECVNLGTGMLDIHTRNEKLHLPSFFRAGDIALATVLTNTAP
jgi:tripeptide aminopeptidase